MGRSKDLASGAAYQDQTESDTRYVNTAGDTMTGTLVAGTRLQVGDSSITQGYPQANFGYVADFQAATGSQTFISIAPPSVSSLGDNGTVIGEDGSDTYITQRGNKNIKLGTSNVNRLIIDGSGRVTMPSQPSFSRRGQYGWQTKSSVDNIGSWYDGYDNTNMLNAGTGVATAPVAGKYMVSFLMYVNDTTTTAHYARPYVNGSVYKDAICYLSSNNGYDNTSGATWFINLGANDTVQWYHLGDIYGYHTWWNMHLLG